MNPDLKTYLHALKAYGLANDIPNVTEAVGQFLNLLIKIKKPKTILEIGCANGYSTLWMAEAAEQVSAMLYTVDHSAPTFAEAQANLKSMGLDHCVDFNFGNARQIIPAMPESLRFDFVFVDGQKASYLDFWHLIETRLNPEAVIIFDDMLAFPKKTKSFSDHLLSLKGFDHLLIPIDDEDGIIMMLKQN